MSLHCFTIPALHGDEAEAAFNAFCREQRVLEVERHFVADGPRSYWALCVIVADGGAPLPAALKKHGAAEAPADAKGRPDYKQLLNASDFAVFAALRVWRKAQAEADGVPVYAVFTNEQLAEIARQRCTSLAALGSIDGIGEARQQRYGAAVLQCVATSTTAHGGAAGGQG
jgi:superfamily II DNA helicase RecQ